jgi:DNA end-binding protein Ku
MGNSIWKGHIAFGLVAFPVKLHAAARSQAVSFHQLHQCDHSRVKQVLYCAAEDQPVSRNELVKGYEYEKDRYVVVEEGELTQISPRSSRVMEVLEFVPEAEVDAVYLDASYYVSPERAGEKPYTLLYEALRRTGQVALAQLTMHSREHLVLLRPGRFGLLVHTLFYRDEIRALEEFRTDTGWVTPQELELARLLVESLTAHFEPAKYKDHYRESLRALIDAKIRGEELRVPGATEPAPPPVVDILEALKASLARAKKPVLVAQQPPQAAPAPKRTRKAIAS